MWGGGDAFAPGFWFDSVGVEFFRVVVWAEDFDDFAFFIEDADAAGELGDGDEIAMEIDGARFRDFFRIHTEERAIEVEVDEAVVRAVADEHADGVEAVIEGDGRRWVNQIHRDDGARALALLVENGHPGIYNVADDRPSPQFEIYDWLAAKFSMARLGP